MKYPHIVAAILSDLWAIEPEKMMAIAEFVALQAAGHKLSAGEIEARIGKQAEADVARRQGAVAVLPLRGVIANRANMMSDISGGTSSEQFGQQFQAALSDDGIKAIVLDVDSPGGTVAGTEELANMIYAGRGQKPIVAQVNARAASAAYWIASAADEIAVTPSGEVGSIGVIGGHKDMSKAMDKAGISNTIITAGKYKGEGHPFGPLDDEAKAFMQSQVDEAYGQFVQTVARNRGASISKVRQGFGQGRMVGASASIGEGMADRVATMNDTLQRFGASLYAAPKTALRSPGARAFAFERERRAIDLT
ncbi:S49 family peptidase [Lichenihabitans psoromatis]|uniref:S49 family peptidase n=1 Tax=Lichenihabitans psoromatis TaxID=2528642 RepID=UPI00103830C6|nr:S49 family peptidase [Lichenihabitans psoromatis]